MLSLSGKRKKEQPGNGSSRPSYPLTTRVGLALGTAFLLSVCLASNLPPHPYTVRSGDVISHDILSPVTASFVDTGLRLAGSAEVPQSSQTTLILDPQALPSALNDLAAANQRIAAIRSGTAPAEQRVVSVQSIIPKAPKSTVAWLLSAPTESFESVVKAAAAGLALEMTQRPVTAAVGDISLARRDLADRCQHLLPDVSLSEHAADLSGQFLRPSMVAAVVPFLSAGALAESAPVYATVHRGDVLAHKGEIATTRLVDELDSLGLNGPPYGILWRLCLVALAIGSMVIVVIFVRLYFPAIYADTRRMALLAFIVISGFMALRFLGFALGLRMTPSQYGFFALMWVTAAGMLVATLIRAEIAVLVVALLSMHTALLLDSQLQFGIAALFSALAGVFSVRRIRQRLDLLRSMAVLCAVNLASVWILTIWNVGPAASQLRLDLKIATGWAILAGGCAPVLFFVGVALLERIFHVTTDLSLLELCDNHQPLLRRLVLEAPGTYAHSVGVASLAEAAAEAIGAAPLWVRVGALYHDIGKISRPYFFVENQQGENLHNKLTPTMSAKIITTHITDGIALARQHKLPEMVVDIIQQHHGTSLVTYFYHQAVITSDSPMGISESSFRYCGPKPQSREAGILMLADTVESVIRSSIRRNPGRLDAVVARAIQTRLADGQLTECNLTFREIDQIQAAFTRVLTAIHHHRVEYPAMDGAEERAIAGAGSGR